MSSGWPSPFSSLSRRVLLNDRPMGTSRGKTVSCHRSDWWPVDTETALSLARSERSPGVG